MLDLLKELVLARFRMVKWTVAGGLIFLILSFLFPRQYRATVTILPPENSVSPFQMAMESIPADLLPGLQAPSNAKLLVEMLQSRSVREKIVLNRYPLKQRTADLLEIWDKETVPAALKQLDDRTNIQISEGGLIHVSVDMETPELAAEVANLYATVLDSVNKAKNNSRAHFARIYIEKQLEKTEKELQKAADSLAHFQQRNKTLSLEDQIRIAIEKAGELKGQILAKEVELGLLKQTMKPHNPVVVRLEDEIQELRKQYQNFLTGSPGKGPQNSDYFIPIDQYPAMAKEFARLVREVKVQETVWTLLTEQYHQARIQEARDVPTIQVLDRAVPPLKKHKPRRSLFLVTGCILGFLGCFLTILTNWALHSITENPENRDILFLMRREIENDLQRLRFWKKQ